MNMGDNFIIWSILCFGVAILLFLIEIFVPSAGLLGFCSAAALIAGVVLLFMHDTTTGLIGAIVSVLAIPAALLTALQLFPHTPIFRLLVLRNPDEVGQDARVLEHDPDRTTATDAASEPSPASLIGMRGQALNELRPVGTCLLAGRRRECLAEQGLIARGSTVEVTHADGMQIKVRQVSRG
jgi:membrane-bound serine protease (ClpP class)